MYKYKLIESYYPEPDEEIVLTSEKKYTYREFEKLILDVSCPKPNDEDYEEYSTRNIFKIAEILVDNYNFNYVGADMVYVV